MIEIAPGSKNIHNMIPLDPPNTLSRSQPRKRHKDIIRQRHDIAVPINKRRLVLRLLRVGDGHQQRRFHIHSAVQVRSWMNARDGRGGCLNSVAKAV